MEISVNIIKQGKHTLIAACDLNLLGKTLKFEKIDFEVSSDFYGGSVVDIEVAVDMLKHGTSVNLVGPVIVGRAIQEGLIHPHAVLKISGIPHAQIIKL